MAHRHMLADAKIRSAKPRERDYRIADGGGLALLVRPNGAKLWQYRFRFEGREQTHSLGAYPDLSLAEARQAHQKARSLVATGTNPVTEKRQVRIASRKRAIEETHGTFEALLDEWQRLTEPELAPHTVRQRRREIKKYLTPAFKGRTATSIDRKEIAMLLKRINRRAPEVARNIRNYVGQLFENAADNGLVAGNPTPSASILGKRRVTRHNPALPFEDVPAFIECMKTATSELAPRQAMQLLILTACRKQEVAHARWSEFDLDEALWIIPAERMKARREHIVPLSKQAVELLREVERYSTGGELLWPNRNDPNRGLSDGTLNAIMVRNGYSHATPHGFRSTFSTYWNEAGANPDVIERCLAHVHHNQVRAAYNRALYLDERRDLLQRWADMVMPAPAIPELADAA